MQPPRPWKLTGSGLPIYPPRQRKHAGHLGEQVAHRGGMAPFDGVASEHDAGKRWSRALDVEHRQHRDPDVFLQLFLEDIARWC